MRVCIEENWGGKPGVGRRKQALPAVFYSSALFYHKLGLQNGFTLSNTEFDYVALLECPRTVSTLQYVAQELG